MVSSVAISSAVVALVLNSLRVLADSVTFLRLCIRSPAALAAENLFLRKQLSLYVERKTKRQRATDSVRFTLARLSRFFDWQNALTIVKPDTLIRWHRRGFRLFWKWKSRPLGRRRVSADLRKLIVEMATNNPSWGGGTHRTPAENRSPGFSSNDSALHPQTPLDALKTRLNDG